MAQMITGGWISQAVYVAAKLRIADLVAQKPQTVEELAQASDAHPPSLYRLLRALVSIGVFQRDADGKYSNTPLSEELRRENPGSLGAVAVMMGEEHHVAWGNLIQSVRTGVTAFDHVYGENFFEYVAHEPESSETFNDAMTGFASQTHAAIVDTYDFSDIGTLVDVGGGHGTLISVIAKHNPHLKGVLFDLPHVVAGAPEVLARHSVADRVSVVGGDFFSGQAPSGDAHIMSHILHDWDDERSIKILQGCRNAVKEGAKLLVVEMVIPGGDEPFFGKWMDLNMLAMTPGGRERTREEYAELFKAAGYELRRVAPSKGHASVVEGVAV